MIEVKGFPRIVEIDKNTGKVKSEKELKNTISLYGRTLLGGLYNYNFNNTDVFESSASDVAIYVSPIKRGKIARFSTLSAMDSFGASAHTSGNIYSIYNGEQKTIEKGVLQYGETIVYRNVNTATEKYVEFKMTFNAPDTTREIGTIYLGDTARIDGSSSSHSVFGHTSRIIAYSSLDEVYVQDSSTIIEIYYKITLDQSATSLPGNVSSNIEKICGLSTDVDTDSDKIFGLRNNPYTRGMFVIPGTNTITFAGSPFNKSYDRSKYSNVQIVFNSNIFDNSKSIGTNENGGHRRNYLITNKLSLNDNNKCGSIYSSCGYVIGTTDDYWGTWNIENQIIPKSKQNNSFSDIKIQNRQIGVYPKKKPASGTVERPFVDSGNFASGPGTISGVQKDFIGNTPEMYYIDITSSGNTGTAKAKITKRPFLGALGNVYSPTYHRMDFISSPPKRMSVYSKIGYSFFNKESLFTHKHGCNYDAAGDRYALFDGHVLLVTRQGVALTHISINNYEIYDKDSVPALPVTMISAIEFNLDTKDIFIGCSNTGLYKMKKSLKDTLPATIEKISGPSKIYAMHSDKHGKMSIVSDRGFEISLDNGATWTTKTVTDLALPTITSASKLNYINAIAVDYTSTDLNSLFIYNERTTVFGAWVSNTTKKEITSASDLFGYSETDPMDVARRSMRINPRSLFASLDINEVIKGLSPDTYASANLCDPSYMKTDNHKKAYPWMLMKSFNFLPGRYLDVSNSEFCVAGLRRVVVFSFGGTVLTTKSNLETVSDDWTSKRHPSIPAIKISDSWLKIKEVGHGATVNSINLSEYVDTYRLMGAFTSKNKPATRRLAAVKTSDINTITSYVSFDFAENPNGYQWTYGERAVNMADIFRDSGLFLVTWINETPQIDSVDSFVSELAKLSTRTTGYDDNVKNVLPTLDNYNSGVYQSAQTYLVDFFTPTNARTGVFTSIIDKKVLVNGSEEFVIPTAPITVDGIELTFKNNGATEAFKVGDYYNFVSTSGFVHDNASTAVISGEMSNFIVSDTLTYSGSIAKSTSNDVKIKVDTLRLGDAEVNTSNVLRNSGPSGPIGLYEKASIVFGDFKFSIDMSKVSGVGEYEIYFCGDKTGTGSSLLSLMVGNINNKYFVYPVWGGGYPSINLATINQYSCLATDMITLEFDSATRTASLKKNGTQFYTTGALNIKSAPVASFSFSAKTVYVHPDTGSIAFGDNYTPTVDGRNRIQAKNAIPFPVFEYANRGYPIVSIGNSREKTGLYDKLFIGLPSVNNTDNMKILIDGVPAKIVYRQSIMDSEDQSMRNILMLAAEKTGLVFPTTLATGEVMIISEAGLIFFSEADIGKQYSINIKYIKDNGMIGLDEYAEE